MYKISELATKVGLSRTALLYYEKLQLITGQRLENGYRVYSDKDVQRLRLIQHLLAGGLTLKECKVCLEAKLDRQLLKNRLNALDQEIVQKQKSRDLLAAILGEGDLKSWHEDLNELAPDAHLDWLIKQGFCEKEALRLKWLSKNMNEHDEYMADFMKVFETLEHWGPGSDVDTKHALSLLPSLPKNILEIGCGKGLATKVLAEETEAIITAIDNEQSALDSLTRRFEQLGLSKQLETANVSMTNLPFDKESFDIIWSEGSAYIMGVEKALASWKPCLRAQGYIVLSDMVWRTDKPSKEAMALWSQEYPDIQQIATRVEQMQKAGYQVIRHFPQSKQAWLNYYEPLTARITELEEEMTSSVALSDIKHEVDICTRFADEFGYHVFILAKEK
ncbi:MerR family transcriptional regulator [Litorilituus lipolyticus]|uniref:MerR family transcriptional regulator n=1 Tax=Litorilituus lipolyticus TaxID=2491017 RepID=A0A502L168_9GAMM|nr:MerR family transcriptional regulator [Litorilituus lipolyticus]TPH15723.1 MerR family transcriptional regulator [Litorilituus lipolyticus]